MTIRTRWSHGSTRAACLLGRPVAGRNCQKVVGAPARRWGVADISKHSHLDGGRAVCVEEKRWCWFREWDVISDPFDPSMDTHTHPTHTINTK